MKNLKIFMAAIAFLFMLFIGCKEEIDTPVEAPASPLNPDKVDLFTEQNTSLR